MLIIVICFTLVVNSLYIIYSGCLLVTDHVLCDQAVRHAIQTAPTRPPTYRRRHQMLTIYICAVLGQPLVMTSGRVWPPTLGPLVARLSINTLRSHQTCADGTEKHPLLRTPPRRPYLPCHGSFHSYLLVRVKQESSIRAPTGRTHWPLEEEATLGGLMASGWNAGLEK